MYLPRYSPCCEKKKASCQNSRRIVLRHVPVGGDTPLISSPDEEADNSDLRPAGRLGANFHEGNVQARVHGLITASTSSPFSGQ